MSLLSKQRAKSFTKESARRIWKFSRTAWGQVVHGRNRKDEDYQKANKEYEELQEKLKKMVKDQENILEADQKKIEAKAVKVVKKEWESKLWEYKFKILILVPIL